MSGRWEVYGWKEGMRVKEKGGGENEEKIEMRDGMKKTR